MEKYHDVQLFATNTFAKTLATVIHGGKAITMNKSWLFFENIKLSINIAI